MTEQELEFWKQVYVSIVNGSLHRPSFEIAAQADAAVKRLRERQKQVINSGRCITPLVPGGVS